MHKVQMRTTKKLLQCIAIGLVETTHYLLLFVCFTDPYLSGIPGQL